jgi:type IV secretory pathway VirB3-like protein
MELPQHRIFVALTRPAINKFGIPHKGFVLNLCCTQLIFLWIGRGNPLYWGVFVIIHIILRALTEWDPNFFRIFQLWLTTMFRFYLPRNWRELKRWGGPRLAAIPCGLPYNAKDTSGVV